MKALRFNGCTARVSHWLFGTLMVEDWGDHWRFSADLFFRVTWFRRKRIERHLFRACLWPAFDIRYVGTPMNERI